MSHSQQPVRQQQRQPATENAGADQSVTAPVGQQLPTRSYLPENVRATSVGLLDQAVADLSAVRMQLQHAHWNVKGIEFYQLHELFQELYESLEPHIDAVAERSSALGGQPMGTAAAVAQQTSIPQLSHGATDGQSMLRELADRLSVLDASLYQQIETASQQGDLDTADLLNEVSRDVTKALWFVESHLQVPQSGGATHQQGAVAPQR
ncbi:DNA starvation/stationary phase protection protein Dps [Haloarcula onubensis]|uniref:DNA starvation/stationary phase protection protein Dps n=1 Tax=Haloarcula onubensis TaxID=2950539 RepID=A0ABU2FV09_9EURY|nr:DNA starvation/stationary phase protection protein Dps [Halomicroarcula sp. S3CR25-11]MDS0284604.1 DNA starvation/stationary phase protection protein Dps [Halomicroarcula sp. S3CR25-11]